WKPRASKGRAQVLHAGRSARPRLRADRPLHHLRVPIAPLLDTLIEIDQAFAELGVLRVAPVDAHQQMLDLIRWLNGLGDVALELAARHGVAFPCEIPKKGIPDRWLLEPSLECLPRAAARRKPVDCGIRLQPEHELELPEL